MDIHKEFGIQEDRVHSLHMAMECVQEQMTAEMNKLVQLREAQLAGATSTPPTQQTSPGAGMNIKTEIRIHEDRVHSLRVATQNLREHAVAELNKLNQLRSAAYQASIATLPTQQTTPLGGAFVKHPVSVGPIQRTVSGRLETGINEQFQGPQLNAGLPSYATGPAPPTMQPYMPPSMPPSGPEDHPVFVGPIKRNGTWAYGYDAKGTCWGRKYVSGRGTPWQVCPEPKAPAAPRNRLDDPSPNRKSRDPLLDQTPKFLTGNDFVPQQVVTDEDFIRNAEAGCTRYLGEMSGTNGAAPETQTPSNTRKVRLPIKPNRRHQASATSYTKQGAAVPAPQTSSDAHTFDIQNIEDRAQYFEAQRQRALELGPDAVRKGAMAPAPQTLSDPLESRFQSLKEDRQRQDFIEKVKRESESAHFWSQPQETTAVQTPVKTMAMEMEDRQRQEFVEKVKRESESARSWSQPQGTSAVQAPVQKDPVRTMAREMEAAMEKARKKWGEKKEKEVDEVKAKKEVKAVKAKDESQHPALAIRTKKALPPLVEYESEDEPLPQVAGTSDNYALQDRQMRRILLEQQEKKRLLMAQARQLAETDSKVSSPPAAGGSGDVSGKVEAEDEDYEFVDKTETDIRSVGPNETDWDVLDPQPTSLETATYALPPSACMFNH